MLVLQTLQRVLLVHLDTILIILVQLHLQLVQHVQWEHLVPYKVQTLQTHVLHVYLVLFQTRVDLLHVQTVQQALIHQVRVQQSVNYAYLVHILQLKLLQVTLLAFHVKLELFHKFQVPRLVQLV